MKKTIFAIILLALLCAILTTACTNNESDDQSDQNLSKKATTELSRPPEAEEWQAGVTCKETGVFIPLHTKKLVDDLFDYGDVSLSGLSGDYSGNLNNEDVYFFYDEYDCLKSIHVSSNQNYHFTLKGGVGIGSTYDEAVAGLGEIGAVDDKQKCIAFFDKDMNLMRTAIDPYDVGLTLEFSNNIVTSFILSTRPGTLPPPLLSSDGILGIYQLSTTEPDSAGGVNAEIQFANLSQKEIKYITFTVTPYNAVKDAVSSDIRSESTVDIKCTGPYQSFNQPTAINITSDNVWYNSDISYMELNSVSIDYTDGTSVSLSTAK